ncbi:hypothetical protein KUV85_15935 [Nocardioides panacisoli]|uniref:hypothetical protein n=1 Tax=Nocardioides panacisoli TaxID=627624 RepID=UPI001C632901|nr:hypothetical protein [Nocardioides panacisoli]QYJ03797.1 hypothetical protein KUV85_15935 [Nocardioides panacisoli]
MRAASPVLALVAGLVLLAGMVGFAVGLPAVADDEAGGSVPADPFPDRVLGGDLVVYDGLEQLPEGAQVTPEQITEQLDEQNEYAADKLGEVFETDVAVTTYLATDLSAQAEASISAGEPGTFRLGLPVDPDEPHGGPWYDVVRQGETACYVAWSSDDQAAAADAVPSAVHCQRGDDGATYEIRAAGLSVDDTVGVLDEIVAHGAG